MTVIKDFLLRHRVSTGTGQHFPFSAFLSAHPRGRLRPGSDGSGERKRARQRRRPLAWPPDIQVRDFGTAALPAPLFCAWVQAAEMRHYASIGVNISHSSPMAELAAVRFQTAAWVSLAASPGISTDMRS